MSASPPSGTLVCIAAALVVVAVLLVELGVSGAPSSLVIIDSRNGGEGLPAITLHGENRPHVVWLDWDTGGIRTATFDRVTGRLVNTQSIDDLGGINTLARPRIVSSGSRLYAAWSDCCGPQGGNRVLSVSISANDGATFSRNVFAPGNDSHDADIAVDDAGTLHLVWQEGGIGPAPGAITYARLPQGSIIFTGMTILRVDNALSPAIAVDGNLIYVAWADANGSLMVSRSTDRGQSFGPAVSVDASRTATRTAPRLAARGGNVFAVWASQESDGWHPRFARATGGLNFTASEDLEGAPGMGAGLSPMVVVGGDRRLYVAWVSLRPFQETGPSIRLRKASLEGGGWQDVDTGVVVSPRSNLYSPELAVDDGGHYFLVYDLEDRDQTFTFQVRMVTDIPLLGELPLGIALLVILSVGLSGVFAPAVVLYLVHRRKLKRRPAWDPMGPP